MATAKQKPVIGWREWVALPQICIPAIKVKVDTGARTSSLHAYDLQIVRRRGVEMIQFKVHPFQRDSRHTIVAEEELVDQRWVKASGGVETFRPVIVTEIELLGQRWPIELSLVPRDSMGFRMLLGRQALRRRFVVDVSRSFCGGKPPVAERKNKKRRKGAGE